MTSAHNRPRDPAARRFGKKPFRQNAAIRVVMTL
jgi:hypothetical protein